MKRIKIIILSAASIFLLSSMAWVKITLLRPALITLPNNIKNVAVIDRTSPDSSLRNKVEQVLTGEILKQDEQAVRQSIDGMIDVCSEYNLYNLIRTSEKTIGGGTKSVFPPAMDWKTVEKLSKEHKADAILAIEIFDTDFLVTNPLDIAVRVLDKQMIPGTGGHINGEAVINFGIRVYDPSVKKIVDEYFITHRMSINSEGNVVNHILNKVEAINQVSYGAGRLYGERISPSYYTITRELYNRPKSDLNFSSGVRKSEVADWKGAIDSWTNAINSSSKKKIIRRAAFNIAVGYEVLGDLEKAKEWASKSYTDYKEKRGNDYYNMLVYRINEEAVVKDQSQQKE